jgi:hypothetical protein
LGALILSLSSLLGCDCAEPSVVPGSSARRGDDDDVWLCREGDQRCDGDLHETCVADGEFLRTETEDCAVLGERCIEGLWCVPCIPDTYDCLDNDVTQCRDDGSGFDVVEECDILAGDICRDGDCVNACDSAVDERSNVGCEYWPVDLDNSSAGFGKDASAQQYAVVVSNVNSVPVVVDVWQSDATYGEPAIETNVAHRIVPNGSLEVFELDRREVDGTPPGRFDWEGLTPGSTLSAHAYRITSSMPIIAYQFNPLDNVDVFSNDASLLLPTSALDDRYVVLSWPQTISDTEDPDTDMQDDRKAFLTVVGTQDETTVTVTLKTPVTPLPERPDLDIQPGVPFDVVLGRYEVLNLETDDFLSDFTGSEVTASAPVAVYAGLESADVPFFDTLATRLCCADHLEEQLMPYSALGRRFAGVLSPPRSVAVDEAGGDVARVVEPEWYRVLAVEPGETHVTTTLPAPDDQFTLGPGEVETIRAEEDFLVEADARVAFGQFQASQQVTGIPNSLPGGDPSYTFVPPLEQWRDEYVFLTPDKYAFDFMTVIAPPDARITYDGGYLPPECVTSELPGETFVIYKCQLSFPRILDDIDPDSGIRLVEHVDQADGVHTISSDENVGLLVYGFDVFVSYAYAGGTDVRRLE